MEAFVQYYTKTKVKEHDRRILQTEWIELPESDCSFQPTAQTPNNSPTMVSWEENLWGKRWIQGIIE